MALSPESVEVVELFDQVFKPLHLPDRQSEHALYRSSLTWLSNSIGRPALLVDLTRANLVATLQAAATAGIGRSRVKSIRTHIGELHKFAHAIGLAPERFASVPLPAIDAARAEPPRGELAGWYREHLRDELRLTLTHKAFRGYDRAVVAFDNFRAVSGHPSITRELVDAFAMWVTDRHKMLSPATVRHYRDSVLRVLRARWPESFGSQATLPHADVKHRDAGNSDAPDVAAAEVRLPRRQLPQDLPAPLSGSLREFYETVYRVERADVTPGHTRDVRDTLTGFYVYLEREPMFSDLTDESVTRFLTSLLEFGLSRSSFNTQRSRICAIWRLAYDRQLVDRLPRVKKLRVVHDEPDSWSDVELQRIIAAIDRVEFRGSGDVGGYPFADFWRAAILLCYYTALRRSSLLRIRTADCNLAAGRIYVAGDSMKNRRGHSFIVGPDAIAALQKIWSPHREFLLPWPYCPDTLFDHFGRIIDAAEIDPSRRRSLQKFHKLRRTSATIIRVNAGLAAASDLLGHSSLAMTLRYVDPSRIPDRDTTRLLAPLVPPAPSASSQDPTPPAASEGGVA